MGLEGTNWYVRTTNTWNLQLEQELADKVGEFAPVCWLCRCVSCVPSIRPRVCVCVCVRGKSDLAFLNGNIFESGEF